MGGFVSPKKFHSHHLGDFLAKEDASVDAAWKKEAIALREIGNWHYSFLGEDILFAFDFLFVGLDDWKGSSFCLDFFVGVFFFKFGLSFGPFLLVG